MATSRVGYTLRPGTHAEAFGPVADLFLATIGQTAILRLVYPASTQYPAETAAVVRRFLYNRSWEPNFTFTVCVDASDKPVGVSFWRRPLSFWEKWFSPSVWFKSITHRFLTIRDYLFPIPHVAPGTVFNRVYGEITPPLLNTERRKKAVYLSTLAVEPKLQGLGLGGLLLRDLFTKADGAAIWLVGLEGVEPYYEKFGFAEVGRMNVGELADWEGGSIMFRE